MQVPILRQLLLCNDLTIQPGWLTHTCVLLSIFLYQTYLEIPLYSFVSRFLIQLYQQFNRMMERGTKRICNSTMNTESFLTLRDVTPSLRNCVKNKRCISWPFLLKVQNCSHEKKIAALRHELSGWTESSFHTYRVSIALKALITCIKTKTKRNIEQCDKWSEF